MAGAEAGMSGGGIQQQQQPQQHPAAVGAAVGAADESSDSEGEHEGPQKLIRKVSTSGQIRSKVKAGRQPPSPAAPGATLAAPGAAAASRAHPSAPRGGGGEAAAPLPSFPPSLSPPPRPAVLATSVPGWQEAPRGGGAAGPEGKPPAKRRPAAAPPASGVWGKRRLPPSCSSSSAASRPARLLLHPRTRSRPGLGAGGVVRGRGRQRCLRAVGARAPSSCQSCSEQRLARGRRGSCSPRGILCSTFGWRAHRSAASQPREVNTHVFRSRQVMRLHSHGRIP